MTMLDYDIAIYGSTSAAMNISVRQPPFLFSFYPTKLIPLHPGGIQIEGLDSLDIDNQIEFQNSTTVGGLALELHRRLCKYYGLLERFKDVVSRRLKVSEVWEFESCVLERVIKGWLAEYLGLVIVKAALVEDSLAAMKSGAVITSVRLTNGQSINAQYFIEATYEGGLLAAAEVTTTVGREPSSQYNESLAGVRADAAYTQFDVPVDPYIIPSDPSSGLLYGISPEPFGEPGNRDRHLQAYSYRLPLTDIEGNKAPIQKPDGYDDSHYELHRR
ncbi:FAD dependent oxidoreductase-domain-containing protein [Aspergillus undulatus]|uniref:FAD dependent oxidoreductase-domain-containing protein n=1 Tax=Aspergillus undulatus TaxID=1810928 RepID=UPI003CCD8DE8